MAGCAGVLLWAVMWCCGSEGVLLFWEVCWLEGAFALRSDALCDGASRTASQTDISQFEREEARDALYTDHVNQEEPGKRGTEKMKMKLCSQGYDSTT